jgi:restriction system protein
MADVTQKRVGELVRGVFQILADLPEGLPAKDILERMKQVVPPTEFEKSDYPNNPGVQRFGKMIRFATIAPVKAGWLVKEKGRWYLTEEGKKALRQYPDPLDFRQESRRLYHQWLDKQPQAAPESMIQEALSPHDSSVEVASTFDEAEETAWAVIEQHLQNINPYDLQKLVAALLRAMGYFIVWDAPPGPDRGIDIIAHNDPLGTSSPRIKVQVKREAKKIDVDGIRSFMSVLADHDVGIFVSTGGFTSNAQTEARTKETKKITLVDLERLVELWIKNYEKVAEQDKRLLPLRPVYYLAPSE